ncbi:hypothetical protein IT570_02050 [Candidatus Sumerlaeota bacterium]|nr:hypothetical protein [Candidatus Sumerlaeota bacterium]
MRRLFRVCLPALLLLTTSCTRLHFDPNGGAETVFVQSIHHPQGFDVTYLRKPEEGPLIYNKNAWTIFWFMPLNHPDLGMWIEQALPRNADAANVRSSVKTPWYGNILFFVTIGAAKMQRVHYQMDPVIFKPRIQQQDEMTTITSRIHRQGA